MTSIQKIVNDLIQQQPYIEEALAQGIINHNEYGRKLKSQVELNLKKQVNDSAVSMAVRRYSKQLKEEVKIKNEIDLVDTDIIIRSGLFEITIQKTPDTLKIIRKIHDIVDINSRDFLTLTYGMYEITIITNKRFKPQIELLLSDNNPLIISKLSALSIKLTKNALEGIGLYYVITKALAWNAINIIEIISTLTELTLIIEDDKINLAHEVINGLIEEKII